MLGRVGGARPRRYGRRLSHRRCAVHRHAGDVVELECVSLGSRPIVLQHQMYEGECFILAQPELHQLLQQHGTTNNLNHDLIVDC